MGLLRDHLSGQNVLTNSPKGNSKKTENYENFDVDITRIIPVWQSSCSHPCPVSHDQSHPVHLSLMHLTISALLVCKMIMKTLVSTSGGSRGGLPPPLWAKHFQVPTL